MKYFEGECPEILYKYRSLDSEYTEKMLIEGEIYFCPTEELRIEDSKEKDLYIFNQGAYYNFTDGIKKISPEKRKERVSRIFSGGEIEPYGVLSMCDSKRESLMYERYSNGAHGLCVGFNWKRFNLSCYGQRCVPKRVSYTQDWIKFNGTHGSPDEYLQMYCTKQRVFSFEKEYRMFYKSGSYRSQCVRLSIQEVVFGWKVTRCEIKQIRSFLKDISGISFYLAMLVNGQVVLKPI